MATWYQLEREGSGESMKAAIEASRAKVDAIRAAQKAGTVTERFDAE